MTANVLQTMYSLRPERTFEQAHEERGMNEFLFSGVVLLVLVLVVLIKVQRATNLRTEQERLDLAFFRARETRKRGLR